MPYFDVKGLRTKFSLKTIYIHNLLALSPLCADENGGLIFYHRVRARSIFKKPVHILDCDMSPKFCKQKSL